MPCTLEILNANIIEAIKDDISFGYRSFEIACFDPGCRYKFFYLDTETPALFRFFLVVNL